MLETLLDGRYNLIRVLGSGGFGQTFVAENTQAPDQPKCVVKQFKPISQDSVFLEVARRLFFNEVEVLKKLGTHPRIPTLLDEFEEEGQFYLVQEYVEGRSLQEEFTIFRKLDEPRVISLVRDVLEILDFVHQNSVIHRDIKPSNLIRRKQDDRIVLIDFGAVKEISTQLIQPAGQTDLTVGIATQGYGPSEQLAGKPRFNSDLYALGMTAIQALTGLHPSQLPTHPVTGEAIWRDHADVTPWFASILDKMVRYHFNQRFQSAAEALDALQQTALVQPTDVQHNDDWNDETAIPATHLGLRQTSLIEPQVTELTPKARLLQRSQQVLLVTVTSLLSTGLVAGMRHLGWLQPLELHTYDRMVQLSPDPGPDPRLLVVGITEADIQEQKRFPLSDATVAKTIQQLQQYKPRAIGLDLFRDLPQEPGRQALLAALKAPNVIAITNLGTPITPAPPEVPPQQVGFNDVPLDDDNVVRRNLMFGDVPEKPDVFYSLSLRLARLYLGQAGIKLTPSPRNSEIAQLGKAELVPLAPNSGGYSTVDDRGYQLLLHYRGPTVANEVSLSDVLKGKLKPEQVQDKIILIGTTAANAKDLFFTPYSPLEKESPRLPGVLIHAHMVSQLLDYATGDRIPVWFWPEPVEYLWVMVWAGLAGSVAYLLRQRPIWIVGGEIMLLCGLFGVGFGLFIQSGWVPIAAPAIAMGLSASGLILYQLSRKPSPSE